VRRQPAAHPRGAPIITGFSSASTWRTRRYIPVHRSRFSNGLAGHGSPERRRPSCSVPHRTEEDFVRREPTGARSPAGEGRGTGGETRRLPAEVARSDAAYCGSRAGLLMKALSRRLRHTMRRIGRGAPVRLETRIHRRATSFPDASMASAAESAGRACGARVTRCAVYVPSGAGNGIPYFMLRPRRTPRQRGGFVPPLALRREINSHHRGTTEGTEFLDRIFSASSVLRGKKIFKQTFPWCRRSGRRCSASFTSQSRR